MSIHVQEVPAEAEVEAEPESSEPAGDAQRLLSVSAEMVRCLLPEFDQVSITVISDGETLVTCAKAGGIATDLDLLQYDLGEGPCVDSLRDAAPVVAAHLGRDDRWGRYVSSATALGLRSQVSTPLLWREGNLLGALNMYSTTRATVAPTTPLIAKALAAQVAGALASFLQIENLHRALETRTTIGMAIGLLMAQYQLSETAAFAVLRRRSTQTNVKIRDIAEEMVAQRSAPGMAPPLAQDG